MCVSSCAVHIVGLAAFHFDLDSRMRDVELTLDVMHDGAQHLLAFANALFGDEDVAAAGDDAGADHPHMEIVDIEHAVTPLMAAMTVLRKKSTRSKFLRNWRVAADLIGSRYGYFRDGTVLRESRTILRPWPSPDLVPRSKRVLRLASDSFNWSRRRL